MRTIILMAGLALPTCGDAHDFLFEPGPRASCEPSPPDIIQAEPYHSVLHCIDDEVADVWGIGAYATWSVWWDDSPNPYVVCDTGTTPSGRCEIRRTDDVRLWNWWVRVPVMPDENDDFEIDVGIPGLRLTMRGDSWLVCELDRCHRVDRALGGEWRSVAIERDSWERSAPYSIALDGFCVGGLELGGAPPGNSFARITKTLGTGSRKAHFMRAGR